MKLFPNLEASGLGVFNRVLTELDLGRNEIGDQGAIAIAEALKREGQRGPDQPGLVRFYNFIGAEGAIAIAEALKVNTVLTQLDIRANNMGDAAAGEEAVEDAG